jgi:hypothetical protein
MTSPTGAQALYRQILLGSLIYSVVLGLLDAYTSIVTVRSYSFLLAASVVLELLTVGAMAIKDQIIGRLRHRTRVRARFLMVFGVWFVLFSSKLVFVWVIDAIFGDDVNVKGLLGIMLVVAGVTVLQKLAELVDERLGGPAADRSEPAR